MRLNAYHRYGESVNRYDALKMLAILLMTADHIGAFLYPDELWWRAVGRICVPIWFFFIGYSANPTLRRDVVICALLLLPLNPLTGVDFFATNILITMVIAKWLLGVIERKRLLEREPLVLWFACLIFAIPSYAVVEYGSFGLMLALLGTLKRKGMDSGQHRLFWLLTAGAFIAMQAGAYGFDLAQQLVVIGGLIGVFCMLRMFELQPLRTQPARLIAVPTKFCARYSLYYYAVHRTLLQGLGE